MGAEKAASPEAIASAEAILQAGGMLDAGVVTVDPDLVVRGWNRWLEAASGRTAADVVGKSLIEVFPAIADSRGEAAFRRALGGEVVVMSQRFHQFLLPLPVDSRYPGFSWMQQSARIAPVLGADGPEGAIAVIEDVTERVAREAELRAAIERAESTSEAKSEFIAGLSHELRTPLGAIIGYADILEAEISGPLLDAQKEHVRRVKAGAWHLMGIIEEILTFSRVEAGREPLHLTTVQAVSVAKDALAMVEPQAEAKGLELRCTHCDIPLELSTDAGKLRQILVNLLGNAVKFTETGEVELRVEAEANAALFHVCDTGPGIPADYLKRIFEPFTQVQSETLRSKAGTGLGLAVSLRLAQLLSGDLTVQSSASGGSCFTLTIPLAAPLSSTG